MSHPIKSKYHAIVRLMEQTNWRDDQPSVPEHTAVHIAARLFPGKTDDLDIAAQQERIRNEAEMVRANIAFHESQVIENRETLSALQRLAYYEMDLQYPEAEALVRADATEAVS